MRGEPEVIVRGEIDDFAPVEARLGRAGRFQHPQPLIGSGLAPILQLRAKVRQRIGQCQTFSGTTNGARYFRVNMAVASGSPLQSRFSASNSRVRPTRYEMLAKCTSTVDMYPSSMGAFRSDCLRLRTASMKFAQLLPSAMRLGPGCWSFPIQVLYWPYPSIA